MSYKQNYIAHIHKLLDQILDTQEAVIDICAESISRVIQEQHAVFVFGASHAGILAQEMFYRTGGLAVLNPILPSEVMLNTRPVTQTSAMERIEGYGEVILNHTPIQAGDILIIHSVSGRNTIAIEMALAAKQKGIQVIAITNLTYSKQVTSRHRSGKRLYECADYVIDNCGDFEDSCMLLEGMDQKIAPTSTVCGAAIVNMLLIEVVEYLLKQGIEPPIFHSANVDGGDAFNQALLEKYKDQIYYM